MEDHNQGLQLISVHHTSATDALGDLSRFRYEFYRCLTTRADALFELIPPGTLTLLVTDGLVERRDRSVDTGMAALRDFVHQDVDLETLSDALLGHFAQDAKDDIALVAFRR